MLTRSIAALLALGALAACQTMQSRSPVMTGNWASADGIFVANFADGRFTSQDAKTGKVLAEGTYTPAGESIQMNWVSATTSRQHAATCRFTGASSVTCDQPGASPFVLTRA